MAKIDDGGRAFPEQSIEGYDLDGMRLRDYFAAHAPPVPDWFDAVWVSDDPRPKPSVPIASLWREYNREERDQTFSAWSVSWGETPEVIAQARDFQAVMAAWQARAPARTNAQYVARIFAWRWAYADGMIRTRNPQE